MRPAPYRQRLANVARNRRLDARRDEFLERQRVRLQEAEIAALEAEMARQIRAEAAKINADAHAEHARFGYRRKHRRPTHLRQPKPNKPGLLGHLRDSHLESAGSRNRRRAPTSARSRLSARGEGWDKENEERRSRRCSSGSSRPVPYHQGGVKGAIKGLRHLRKAPSEKRRAPSFK